MAYLIYKKNTLTAAFRLACLEIRLRNEETINSRRTGTMTCLLWPKIWPKILAGGGYFQKNWVGVCCTLQETLNLFQTKICDFPYPISDLKPWSPVRDRSTWQAVKARTDYQLPPPQPPKPPPPLWYFKYMFNMDFSFQQRSVQPWIK